MSNILLSVYYLSHLPSLYTVVIKVTLQKITSGDIVIAGEYEAANCCQWPMLCFQDWV